MDRSQLRDIIFKKRSVLCVGLDTDMSKIPKHLLADEDPVFAFNKAITFFGVKPFYLTCH